MVPTWGWWKVFCCPAERRVTSLAAGAQSYRGFTQAGGSLSQAAAGFKARTQAVQQRYGQAPQQQAPEQQPWSAQPQQNPRQPYGQQQPYGRQRPTPPYNGS